MYKFQFYYGPVNAQQTENMHIDEKKDRRISDVKLSCQPLYLISLWQFWLK